MLRKARAGHVTGGRVFGYDNLEILGADGKRSHVERRINETEAAVIRRIFDLCATGHGYTRVAKLLNSERAPSPRPQQGRPMAWAPTSVKEVLDRRLYIGDVIWNQTRKRHAWGQQRQAPRPTSEWEHVARPDLRKVSDAAWTAARVRLDGVRAQLMTVSSGSIGQRRYHGESRYLLVGFAKCAICGTSLCAMSRSHGNIGRSSVAAVRIIGAG